MEEEGERSSRNMYKGTMDKDRVGVGLMVEGRVGGVGENGGGKMETTIVKQQ